MSKLHLTLILNCPQWAPLFSAPSELNKPTRGCNRELGCVGILWLPALSMVQLPFTRRVPPSYYGQITNWFTKWSYLINHIITVNRQGLRQLTLQNSRKTIFQPIRFPEKKFWAQFLDTDQVQATFPRHMRRWRLRTQLLMNCSKKFWARIQTSVRTRTCS